MERADRKLVDVALWRAALVALVGLVRIDAVELALLLFGEIKHVAVRVVGAVGRERPGRGPPDDVGVGEFPARPLHHLLDVVHRHAEMVEPAHIAIPQRIDIETDIAVTDVGAADRPALSLLGGLQAKHRFVEARLHRPVRAAHGDMVDLRKHAVLPDCESLMRPNAAAGNIAWHLGASASSSLLYVNIYLRLSAASENLSYDPRRCASLRGSPHRSGLSPQAAATVAGGL